MATDDPIGRAVDHVADGKPVDWDALAKGVNDEERERLACLRILGAIAGVHRSGDDSRDAGNVAVLVLDPSASTRPPTHLIGETWGRYTLLEVIGAGSFGSVYRAWDPDLECELAIKILHGQSSDSQLKERLIREGRALAKVRDPNVVSVLGVESYGERVGLCMEFVHGETLEDLLRSQKTLNAREAILVGQDVCRALVAVHRAGFVHRDVKARNIMRERAGRILLMDFGTGREVAHVERAGHSLNVAGTPLYMAPEALAGQAASHCSDVYSVGVLLYHLVTGSYPVEGQTLQDLRAAHMSGKRTSISERRADLPTAFISVVNRALAPDPQQRFQSAGELLESLAAAGGEALPVPNSRARIIFQSAGVLCAVVVGLIGLGAVSSRYFNAALGRSEFTDEGIWKWFGYGAISLVAPIVLVTFALLGLALLGLCRSLLLGASAKARKLEDDIKLRVRLWKLDDVGNLSSCALLVSTTALVVGWWYCSPLFGALMIDPNVSTVPASQLTLLAPKFEPLHETYSGTFTWVTIICLMVWYLPLRLAAQRREPLNRGLLAGGGAVLVLAILLLDFPYRMLWQNDRFEVALWQGARCYILGERDDDVLLFCPLMELPRNRVVSRNAKDLQRLGTQENMFTQFSANQ